MTGTTPRQNPADEVEEEATPELDGQATTVEEAMDAATDEEGFADESAYTTPAGSISDETPADD